MFVGIGVVSTFGAAYHVFTHAFFKAVLFLTCGAIMHGFAGQLDLRRISGLRHMTGWKITAWTMLVGCLCLAGIPGTSGYFSKDAILAQTFITPGHGFSALGWIMVITAGLTAYYTFRVWFRVCAGAPHYELGEERHDDHGDEDAGHDAHAGEPHAPGLAINLVLVVIAVGAVLAAVPYFMSNHAEGVHGGWVADMVHDSTAGGGLTYHGAEHGSLLGLDPHNAMYFLSGGVGAIGLLIAWFLHLRNRSAADALKARLLARPATRWLPVAMENKWYVDEIYHALIRAPLWAFGHVCYLYDRFVIDFLFVDGTARIPRGLGKSFQPLQNGILQSYALSMAGGVGLVAVLVLFMPRLIAWLGGGG
jgi:NADH-quinone oxidoreductase subunit L